MSIQANIEESITVEEVRNPDEFDFGFEAEYQGFETITGKDQTDISNSTGYGLGDLEIGNTVNGRPEVVIFENNEKDDDGEYVKNYQSIRIRLVDHNEYVDLYANIPRRDEKGFVSLYHYQDFYRTGFDLAKSFMRFLDETNIVDETGEEINMINKINIENVCKAIDMKDYAKFKVVKGASEEYDSFILMDMKNL